MSQQQDTSIQQQLSVEEKLVTEYSALAADYDQRWATYLAASLAMTFEVMETIPATRVLDVACGTGLFLRAMADRPGNAELTGLDRVPAMLVVAGKRIGQDATLLQGDAATLPFDDAGFDLVVCNNALHYFHQSAAALQEMRRVVTSTGHVVITDWCRDYLSMKLLDRILPGTSHAHARTFSTQELEHDLALAGFSVVSKARKKINWFWGLMTVHATPA